MSVAVHKDGHKYTAKNIAECIRLAGWEKDIFKPLELYTGLSNFQIYCPTIERDKALLKMTWDSDIYKLVVWLIPDSDTVRYSFGMNNYPIATKKCPYGQALTLLAYWAGYLQETHPKKGN